MCSQSKNRRMEFNYKWFIKTPMPECKSLNNSQRHLDDIIDHKCRKLGKSGASKGSALHLAQWMRGQLGGSTGPLTPDDEPEPEVWSTEMLRRRSEQLQILGVGQLVPVRNESRCEEFEISDTERSASRSTTDSQRPILKPLRFAASSMQTKEVTVRSGGPEHQVPVCRKCHKTCLANSAISPQTPNDPDNDLSNLEEDDTDYDEKWGPLMLMGMSTLGTTVGFGTRAIVDPFSPTEVPLISVLPPTPDTLPRSSSFQWDDGDLSLTPRITSSGVNTSPGLEVQHNEDNRTDYLGTFVEEDEDSGGENSGHDDEEHPYRSLSSATCMKRYGTLASLEILEGDELEDAAEDATDSEEDGEDWESDGEEHTNDCPGEIQPQFEVVTQSLRGWTARAGSFVAEKMALFERLGEDSRAAAAFLDRYLRPTAESQPTHVNSPPDPATTSSDDCETSAATSGEEVWGTPTSGGELDDEVAFPSAESAVASQQESPLNSTSSTGAGDEETELMMDELLATPPLSSSARGFPPRRRLEPLLEEEDTDSPPSSTPVEQETPSPEQGSGAGVVADSYPAPAGAGSRHQAGFFNRLRLRQNRNESPPIKSKKLLGFLSGRKSADAGSGNVGGKPLFRLFHHDAVDDIPTTLPHQLTTRRNNDKQLERRFWKQLRRRRGGGVIPSSA